ncbi:MAG: hypothetical protein AB1711_04675 [Thermodesulfobacteriota bacterium]
MDRVRNNDLCGLKLYILGLGARRGLLSHTSLAESLLRILPLFIVKRSLLSNMPCSAVSCHLPSRQRRI